MFGALARLRCPFWMARIAQRHRDQSTASFRNRPAPQRLRAPGLSGRSTRRPASTITSRSSVRPR